MQEQLLLQEDGGNLVPITLNSPQDQEKWEKLLQSSCVVKLKISLPSNTTKVKKEKIKETGEAVSAPVLVDSAKNLVKVSTNKYVSKTYESLSSLSTEVRKHIKDLGYPYYGHDGEYIIPIKKLHEALTYLKEKKEVWDEKVELFLSQWGDIKTESLEQLRALGDSRNYPPVDAIKEKFSWFYTVKTISSDFSLPDNLQEVDEDAYLETVEVMRENLSSTLSLLTSTITSSMSDILGDLTERLGGEKKLSKGAFEKGLEVCDFILHGGGNILGDATLEEVCSKFKLLISGDSQELVKVCKDSEEVKKNIQSSLASLAETLKNNIISGNNRSYDV